MQGEHGTGRNMAPFVEMEWGRKAYGLMWDLKELFDPDYVLNPGVVLNQVGGPRRLLLGLCGFVSAAARLCSLHLSRLS